MVSSGKTKQDQKKKNQGMLFLRLFNAEKKMGSALNVNLHDNLTVKISFIMNWLPVTGLYVS